ncbi:MAG: bifunctional nuclease family protein [Muribaculaceae bacterium]|nr:bifunctional nuclease family protein [Muribaculaceae bacterium]
MKKIRLELIGITYNQIESGVYAVVLQEAGGNRRIPIIIGFPEAQAIECKLQEVITPRPLTHDLLANIMSSFGLSLQEVNIYRQDNGVFCASLSISDGLNTHVIDSRSSDAIALAIRVDAPIFTSEQVLEESGFDASETPGKTTLREKDSGKVKSVKPRKADDTKSLTQLQAEMQKAAEAEDYEEAARLKALIDNKKNNNSRQPE